jgi:hypothetical protein
MSELKDMAYTREEKRERNKGMVAPENKASADIGPDYPWGLTLRLEKEALAKLGKDDDLPHAGDEWHVVIVAKVTAVREEDRISGDGECSVELQVTHMRVLDEGEEKDDDEEGLAKSRGTARRPASTVASYHREGTGE